MDFSFSRFDELFLDDQDAHLSLDGPHDGQTERSPDFETFTKDVCGLLESPASGFASSRQKVWRQRHRVYHRLLLAVEEADGRRKLEPRVHGPTNKLRSAIRTILKMEQHLFGEWKVERRKWNDRNSRRITNALMAVVTDQDCPSDIVFLAGTAFAFHLHSLDVESKEAVRLFVEICLPGGEVLGCRDGAIFTLSFEYLPLVYGLVACGKSEVLMAERDDSRSVEPLVLQLFPSIVEFCETSRGGREYQSFQTLMAWLRFVERHATRLSRHFDTGSPLVDAVMRLLDMGWASSVAGVSDMSWDAFGILLEIHRSEELTTCLLRSALNLSWKAKGKYPRLAGLVKYVGAAKVSMERPCFLEELSESLVSNRLSSASRIVYRTFLMHFRSELGDVSDEELSSKWAVVFLPSLLGSLRSSNSLTLHNAIRHWLPVTLQNFPTAFEQLMQHLADDRSPESFLAQMSTIRLARSQGIIDSHALELPVVSEALRHLDDEVRAEAFAVVCSSRKKSDGLADVEMDFVRRFLPLNLNVDCASFRRKVLCNVRILLVRVRDSFVRQCRKPNRTEEKGSKVDSLLDETLARATDFLDWLVGVCQDGLIPGAGYQRRSTCLGLYGCVLDTFVSTPTGHNRKGVVPVKCDRLLAHFRQVGKFCPLSGISERRLLFCLFDPMDEVQATATTMLANHFSGLSKRDDGDVIVDDRLALRLCSSPKTMNTHSGAHVLSLVYRHADSGRRREILRSVLTELARQLAVARTSMLQASSSSPMHGLLLALRFTLCTEATTNDDRTQELWQILSDCFDIAEQIHEHVLGILSARSSRDSVAPSFAEMGVAIDDIIVMNSAGSEEFGEPTTSSEHQLVLSCCWLSLKESCLLLGGMVHRFLSVDDDPGLSEAHVSRTARLLLAVLTKCRHRGAIESCNVGFELFCKRLLDTGEPRFTSVVGHILDEALVELEVGASALSTSVTRRSAGLPLLMATIIRCDRRPSTPFLNETIARLLVVARKPLPRVSCLVDVPQVHAFHVFRALVHDARLSQDILRHVVPMTMACFDGFHSPSWAVRNAVLQLFGALVPVIVGQKKAAVDEDDGTPTMTFSEFFCRWPQLSDAVEDHLSDRNDSARSVSVVPILSLLCSLTPRDDGEDLSCNVRTVDRLLELVRLLLGSRVWHVRRLAALFMARACPPGARHGLFLEYASRLRRRGICVNGRHGILVLLKHLVVTMKPPCDDSLIERLCRAVMDVVRLSVIDWSFCPVLGASALEMFTAARHRFRSSRTDLTKILDGITSMESEILRLHSWKPGFSLYMKRVHQTRHHGLSASDFWKLLPVERTTLEALETVPLAFACEIGLGSNPNDERGDRLLKFLKTCSATDSSSLLVTSLELAFEAYTRTGIRLSPQPEALRFVKSLVDDRVRGRHASVVGLALWATIIDAYADDDLDVSNVESFVSRLRQFCKPRFSEHFRLWTARSLAILGRFSLPDRSKTVDTTKLENILVGVFDSSMTLLQDEQADVRREATRFVGSLVDDDIRQPDSSTSSVHPNLAMQMLSEHFVRRFGWSEQLRDHLWQKIGGFDDPSSVLERLTAACNDVDSSGLFRQDDVNVYAEKCFIRRFYGRTLVSLLSEFSSKASKSEWLGTVITDVSTRARLMTDFIVTSASGAIDIEWYCRPRIFRLVANVGLQLDVTLSLLDDGSSSSSAVVRDDLLNIRSELKRRTAWPPL